MPQESLHRLWDVIVIGTGMGGATAGYALAKAGFSVLFCEKGAFHERRPETLRGDWAETFYNADVKQRPLQHYLQRAGRRAEPIVQGSERTKPLIPILGRGSGGSSALYGMVLERFFPIDFEPQAFAGFAPNTTAPQRWPISFAQLAPYYSRAEHLYCVRSGVDELRPPTETRAILTPPAFGRVNTKLVEHFRSLGLHPYHLPMACDYVPECRECIGYLCAKGCKRDSSAVCLRPAIDTYGADIIDDCAAEKLIFENGQITSVLCRRGGQDLYLRARTFILAAGAIETPAILFRSQSQQFPRGLANTSGQVGRNLMRHLLDYYIVPVGEETEDGQLIKQIAFNDLYLSRSGKLGTVQSNGRLPPAALLSRTYLQDLRDKLPALSIFGRLLEKPVERYLAHLLSRSVVFASLLEDYPYSDNRVEMTKSGQIAIYYEVGADDRRRLQVFRQRILELLRPYRVRPVLSGEKLRSLGHACGTCRFGDDPADSVLDVNNRAHDVDNLFIVDSSFLPTSSGTNPSLTIAANALRVADHLIHRRQGASAAIHAV